MARRLHYSARYPLHTTKEVYAALGSRAYWDARITEMRDRTETFHEIVNFETDDSRITIESRHTLPRSQMPELARAIAHRDMDITRREWYGPYEMETSGEFEALIPGGAGSLTGSMRLFETDTGSTLRFSSHARVAVPFLGKQLEQLILINLVELFRAEAKFTIDYLDDKL